LRTVTKEVDDVEEDDDDEEEQSPDVQTSAPWSTSTLPSTNEAPRNRSANDVAVRMSAEWRVVRNRNTNLSC